LFPDDSQKELATVLSYAAGQIADICLWEILVALDNSRQLMIDPLMVSVEGKTVPGVKKAATAGGSNGAGGSVVAPVLMIRLHRGRQPAGGRLRRWMWMMRSASSHISSSRDLTTNRCDAQRSWGTTGNADPYPVHGRR
jgi:hypothetical protein